MCDHPILLLISLWNKPWTKIGSAVLILGLILVLDPGPCKALDINIDPLIPIIGHGYYVRMTVQLKRDDYSQYKHPISFEAKNKGQRCNVTDWKFCQLPPQKPVVWKCYCSSREEKNDGVYYRFFFNVGIIDDSFIGEQVTAWLTQSMRQTSQMNVVRFVENLAFKETIRCCPDEAKVLKWRLVKVGAYKGMFQVIAMFWHLRSKEEKETDKAGIQVANVTLNATGHASLSSINDLYQPILDRDGHHYHLQIRCSKQVDDKEIFLTVRFNKTRHLEYLNAHSNDRFASSVLSDLAVKPRDPLTALLGLRVQFASDYSTTPANTPGHGKSVKGCKDGLKNNIALMAGTLKCDTTIPTTTTTTTTTTTATTTPGTTSTSIPVLPYEHEDQQLYDLQSSVHIKRDVPPSKNIQVSIKVKELQSRIGQVLVTCTVRTQKDEDIGDPPVNITIYARVGVAPKTLLITKSNVQRLVYSTDNLKDLNFICRLEGFAMKCVPEGDPRSNEATTTTTETTSKAFAENIDLNLILYALELFLALTLVLWTVTNFVEHIRLLLWRERMRLEQKLRSEKLKTYSSFGNRFNTEK